MTRLSLKIALVLAALLWGGGAALADVTVAVAANFATAAAKLATAFTRATGTKAVIVVGSTGKLYAQIRNGAPFDVFLSADVARVARLQGEGALAGNERKIYALGRLVLYAREAKLLDAGLLAALESAGLRHLAMADPALAPYGMAARQVLAGLERDRPGLRARLADKLVLGVNVGQAFAFVRTGNAGLGLVARGQMGGQMGGDTGGDAGGDAGAWIDVPQDLYAPVQQEAGLLVATPGARAFYDFLSSDAARALIGAAGYGLPAKPAEPSR